jgi:hypothetical protein
VVDRHRRNEAFIMVNTLATPFHDPLLDTAPNHIAFANPGPGDAGSGFNIQNPIRFLVSDLFSVRTGKRGPRRERTLATVSRTKRFTYSGDPLDQFDLDVLLHCAAAAGSTRPGGVWLEHSVLVRALGRRNDAANRTRVCESLERLQDGAIGIQGHSYRYLTRLVNRALLYESAAASLVEVNKDFADSIRSVRGLELFLTERRGLGANSLAKWLHGVLWIFPAGFSSDIDTLGFLCGMPEHGMKTFRSRCEKALVLLTANGVVTDACIEASGQLHVAGRRNTPRARACGFLAVADRPGEHSPETPSPCA